MSEQKEQAEPSGASAGSHRPLWNTPALAMPQPNIDVLLWCDQGVVIGYHNGCGDWRLSPIEEEPRPWRLSATNVTHWAELPEPPPEGYRQPSAVLTAEERGAVEFFAEACKWWSSKEGQSNVAIIRGLLDRTK